MTQYLCKRTCFRAKLLSMLLMLLILYFKGLQRGVAPPAARRIEDMEEELFLFLLLLLSPSLFGVYDMRNDDPNESLLLADAWNMLPNFLCFLD